MEEENLLSSVRDFSESLMILKVTKRQGFTLSEK